ncbi:MAG: methionine--tRNA ligase [Deltaproteobacteria bacterium]|nr:methionine--tRNA ligase [Deltaproteobacteria bacterium]
MDRTYLTTPIFYVNAEPHLGHTYTMVVVDTMARYCRARGLDTFFLTGTDEHGDKIAEAAGATGETPKAYADRISTLFRSTWDALGIRYDHFIRTTDEHHRRFVQHVLDEVNRRGDIYFGEYGGLYCTGCERFYLEKELVDGKCPDHKIAPKLVKEENYFFRMSRYQDRLLAHIEAHPDWIRPERYRNEVLGFLREPLEDLCISRPKSRLEWGIDLPFDRNFVTYVWFDALLNYTSAAALRGEAFFDGFWPCAEHFIAKDILKPHGVYWPTMLMAAGIPLYRHLNVHGYWTVEGDKMSKSLGNVIAPLAMTARYGTDAFRYFLLRESVFGLDADFREETLVSRCNGDLANNLGNLVSRTLSMVQRYFQGKLPERSRPEPLDDELERAFTTAASEIHEHMRNLGFNRALEALLRGTDRANKYIAETAPFTLAKQPAQMPRVGTILRNLAEALLHTARLVAPFLPDTGGRILDLLDVSPDRLAGPAPRWGEGLATGHVLKAPVALFPRIDARPS